MPNSAPALCLMSMLMLFTISSAVLPISNVHFSARASYPFFISARSIVSVTLVIQQIPKSNVFFIGDVEFREFPVSKRMGSGEGWTGWKGSEVTASKELEFQAEKIRVHHVLSHSK